MHTPPLAKPDYFTNAQTSDIQVPVEQLRPLIKRDSWAALRYMATWLLMLAMAAGLVWFSGDHWWR